MNKDIDWKSEICSETEIDDKILLKEESKEKQLSTENQSTKFMDFESMFIECSDNNEKDSNNAKRTTKELQMNENAALDKDCANAPVQTDRGESNEECTKFLNIYDKTTLLSILSACHKHPVLWDKTAPHSNNIRFRERAYKSIANDAGKMNEWRSVRDLVKSLRVRILNELLRKKEAEAKGASYTPLWEYDIVSFLPKEKKKREKTTLTQLTPIEEDAELSGSNCSESDDEDLDDELILNTGKKFDKKTMLAIFSSYDKHSILWDLDDPMRKNIRLRVKAYKSIANEVEMPEEWENIRDCIRRLSYRLHAEQKKKMAAAANNQTYVPLWKHDMFAFLKLGDWKSKPENAPKRTSKLPYTKLTDLQCLKFIKLYKSHSCLWDEQDMTYRFKNRRKEALVELLETMNDDEKVTLTHDELEREIFRIRKMCSMEKAHKQECKKLKTPYHPKCKFYKEIAFLELDVGPFICSVCNKKILGVTQYKIHKSSHDGSLPFTCPVCSHGFNQVCNYTVHLRRHLRDFDFVCKECNKGFASSNELTAHMGTHSKEPSYFCEICGQSFRTRKGKNTHTHGKRVPRFKCDICQKMYFEKRSLNEHMNSHLDVRNCICNVCGKGFRSKKQLAQHKDIHSERKRHVCRICLKSFAQRAGLSGHMRSHGTSLANLPSRNNNLAESD